MEHTESVLVGDKVMKVWRKCEIVSITLLRQPLPLYSQILSEMQSVVIEHQFC